MKNHHNGFINLDFPDDQKPQALRPYKNLLKFLPNNKKQKVTNNTSFLKEAQILHDKRQETKIKIEIKDLSINQVFKNDFTRTTERDSFELAQEHIFHEQDTVLRKVPIFVLNKKRDEMGENWKLWSQKPNPCRHCHSKHHETYQCFLHLHTKKESPIKSTRKKYITKWFRSKPPMFLTQFPDQVGQGQDLLEYLENCIIPRGNLFRDEINQELDTTNLFPETFSQIQRNFHNYMALGFKKPTLDHLIRGWSPTWIKKPPNIEITQQEISKKFRKEVLELDKEHLKSGRISEVPIQFLNYIAPRFAIDQSNAQRKKIRTIWNGRHLTPYLPHRPFRLPTLKKLRGMFTGLLVSIDLKKAYLQFPLDWNARRFFGFRSDINPNKAYCFNSIPFGLSTAPAIFQNFSQEIANIIHKMTGWKVYVYLDDFIIQISKNIKTPQKELQERMQFLLRIFEILGLRINEKSEIFPSTELKWLGAYINTEFKRDFPTIERLEKFITSVKKIQDNPTATLEDYQIMRGIFTSIAPPNASFIARPIDDIIASTLSKLPPEPKESDYRKISKEKITKPIFFDELCNIWYEDIIYGLNPHEFKEFQGKNFIIVSDASENIGGAFCFNHLQDNEFLTKPDISTPITKIAFPIDQTCQVGNVTFKKGQTSSFIRELNVLVQAAENFQDKWTTHDPENTRLVFYLDNLGLVWSLQNQKFKNTQALDLFTRLKNITKNFKTLFLWHPRDTEAASLADFLSKTPQLEASRNLLQMIKEENVTEALSTETLLRLTPLSDTQIEGKICIIHPYTSQRQTQIIVSWLESKKYSGYVVIPDFPTKNPSFSSRKHRICYVPFTRDYFKTHLSIYNPRIRMNVFKF